MVIPLIYLTETLPISINGLGVREGAFVFFFTQAGYAAEKALACNCPWKTRQSGWRKSISATLRSG